MKNIDINFNFYSDANGGDPDSTSPTLRSYHKMLWSKKLPNGSTFNLNDNKSGKYLYHLSEKEEFILGSDAITHSYQNHKRKNWLISQIKNEAQELHKAGSTIAGYLIFPKNKINNLQTINQYRGTNPLIDDRFDLTLECIRLFYIGQTSPLYDTFLRYKNYFDLFVTFKEYVDFFLLNDLIDEDQKVKFYLPFNNFATKPKFESIEDYRNYKKGVMTFIKLRNERIDKYANH